MVTELNNVVELNGCIMPSNRVWTEFKRSKSEPDTY